MAEIDMMIDETLLMNATGTNEMADGETTEVIDETGTLIPEEKRENNIPWSATITPLEMIVISRSHLTKNVVIFTVIHILLLVCRLILFWVFIL